MIPMVKMSKDIARLVKMAHSKKEMSKEDRKWLWDNRNSIRVQMNNWEDKQKKAEVVRLLNVRTKEWDIKWKGEKSIYSKEYITGEMKKVNEAMMTMAERKDGY